MKEVKTFSTFFKYYLGDEIKEVTYEGVWGYSPTSKNLLKESDAKARIKSIFRKCICTYCACYIYPEFQIMLVIPTFLLYRFLDETTTFNESSCGKVSIIFFVTVHG